MSTSKLHEQEPLVYPGYDAVLLELTTLLTGYPPPFTFIHDSEAFEVTTKVTRSLLEHLSATSSEDTSIAFAHADAACCLSQRSLFEAVIHSLVDFEPEWKDGCSNWESADDIRWNENVDSFLQGLRRAYAHIRQKRSTGKEKGKEREATDRPGLRVVLLIEGAERLRDVMPDVLVPLTRLNELSQLDLCVIFVSRVGWEVIKPPLAASPDPYFIDIPPPTKETAAQILISQFPGLSEETSESTNLYHPSLQNLYSHFVTILCDICHLFTRDPQELQYIAAARWPGFVKLVADANRRKLNTGDEGGMDVDEDVDHVQPPSEEDRLRLIRLISGSFPAAFESLYPRLMNADDWAKANQPPSLASRTLDLRATTNTVEDQSSAHLLEYLPKISKYILVASYLASTNPAKSDLRMFGRGLDEKKRKRRAMKASRKTKGGVAKIAQRLAGPSPFPIDRLVAILGVLLEEYDADSRMPAEEFSIPGEYTDMEISRVDVYSSILELVAARLLHRTTKADQLDGPATFKSAVSYDTTLALAKDLKIPLLDLLWEPVV
ncbi:hypothetical protein FA15DRAFT_751948 [Coprinopsis marcescibilis]|uniref:Origin recognition complex subunit 5 n=1 Tax=Coprinopsis marcescibilis TaxID=230819 RepID=A0A5C3LAH0_COPMA|nr:hypothetical protein FA15DRAFT_751948 [Coprinopsis marcescibilis]